MVSVDLPGGWRLIGNLIEGGFPIAVAFWARLSDEEKWRLYLASPVVDEQGSRAAYLLIHGILHDAPEWGLVDAFSLTVLDTSNTMARAIAELVKPKVAGRPYRGITRFKGGSLGGFHVDGAFIYPPWEPGINPVG